MIDYFVIYGKRYLILFPFVLLLTFGTGLHSDDWNELQNLVSIDELLFKDGGSKYLLNSITFLIYRLQFDFIGGKYLYLYDIIKAFVLMFAIYSSDKFFGIFLSKNIAFISAVLFIFLPNHDAVTYWTVGQYLTIIFGLSFFSFFILNRGNFISGGILALIASFSGYGSPPVIWGLSIIFLYRRKWKEFFIYITPAVLYLGLYFYIQSSQISGDFRFNLVSSNELFKPLISGLTIQVLSAIDAGFGPSFFLKIIFSIQQIAPIDFLLSILFALFLIFIFRSKGSAKLINSEHGLLLGATSVFLFSIGIYSLTEGYPQIAFGLGNRVTIYVSFLFVVLLALFVNKKPLFLNIAIVVFAFSVFGLSSHWKDWNQQQMELYSYIKSNKTAFDEYSTENPLFVTGMQYSKLSELDHIDFLSTSSASPFFSSALDRNITTVGLNQYYLIEGSTLINTKFSSSYQLKGPVKIFNSNEFTFHSLNIGELQRYIDSLTRFKRHWASLDEFGFVINIIKTIDPRYSKSL